MSVLEERDDYLKNPYFEKREYGDFSPFYITIAICTVLAAALFILNIVIGCCSRHSRYWNDPHTGTYIFTLLRFFNNNILLLGNRWIIPLWTTTPHKQPPLDLKELELDYIPPPQYFEAVSVPEYSELQKRESDI